MEGNRGFARWRLWNNLVFGLLAFLCVPLMYAIVVMATYPADDQWGGRLLGFALAWAVWSIGRSRYTQRCRKIALAAEWEKLNSKKK